MIFIFKSFLIFFLIPVVCTIAGEKEDKTLDLELESLRSSLDYRVSEAQNLESKIEKLQEELDVHLAAIADLEKKIDINNKAFFEPLSSEILFASKIRKFKKLYQVLVDLRKFEKLIPQDIKIRKAKNLDKNAHPYRSVGLPDFSYEMLTGILIQKVLTLKNILKKMEIDFSKSPQLNREVMYSVRDVLVDFISNLGLDSNASDILRMGLLESQELFLEKCKIHPDLSEGLNQIDVGGCENILQKNKE